MNFGHILLVVGLCTLVTVSLAQDADYLDEVEQKPSPSPRPSILRRPIIGQRGKAAPATTTTTTPAPEEAAPAEELSDDVQYDDEEAHEDPTTTPASRKLKSGVVRPFRSNDDLLAALKRRRAEAANGKSLHPEPASSPAVADAPASSDVSSNSKNSQGGRRRFNLPAKTEQPISAPAEESSASSKRNRNRFGGRGIYKTNAASPVDNGEIAGLESSQQAVEVKPRSGFKPGQRRF